MAQQGPESHCWALSFGSDGQVVMRCPGSAQYKHTPVLIRWSRSAWGRRVRPSCMGSSSGTARVTGAKRVGLGKFGEQGVESAGGTELTVLSLRRSRRRLSSRMEKEIISSRVSASSLVASSSLMDSLRPERKSPRSALSFQPDLAAKVLNSTENSATLREP